MVKRIRNEHVHYCTEQAGLSGITTSCVKGLPYPPLCSLVCTSKENASDSLTEDNTVDQAESTFTSTENFLIEQLLKDPQMDSITEGLIWYFGDNKWEAIDQWLNTECPALDGQIPIECIDFVKLEVVENAINMMIVHDYMT